jgi:ankyrin repeat protein
MVNSRYVVCDGVDMPQKSTSYLISRGADIEASDTYGYRPLHRMASNNLAIGAEALLASGAGRRISDGRLLSRCKP